MLGALTVLLVFQLVGEVVVQWLGLPVPGPVCGMLLLFVALTVLWLTGTPYQTYFDGAQFVHFLLGPATVALAIPLYAQFARLRALLAPLLLAWLGPP
ncbi:MAG: LrgB family protein [Thiotrichales bacterium]